LSKKEIHFLNKTKSYLLIESHFEAFNDPHCEQIHNHIKNKKLTITIMEQESFSMPRIGDKAPEFEAVTTQGTINFPADYAGNWVILFSHPADFTPVCTSEFMTFASMADQFERANCQLVGLSVDGLYSHIAWLRTIKEKIEYKGMKDVEVKFPLIEDITMNVAKKYGMIQPGESNTKAVRAVFFIDPKGIIRTIIYYPLSLGRNFDELYRVLIALQTADQFNVATPADWRPGDDVIIPTAGSCGVAKERMEDTREGATCHDWFFCTKKLDKNIIMDKILKTQPMHN
jgi:peroxiredoxin (alkyl hydroperoxide reductase subunit C)